MARTLAMFTDVSLCIGCRACQSYRLVRFFEEPDDKVGVRWHMMSDVCKHCAQAGCLEACPTGAIYRTEFGTVNINQDICNGCRYCVSACPFGVVAFNVYVVMLIWPLRMLASTTGSGLPARRRARPSPSGSATGTSWRPAPGSAWTSSVSRATRTPSSTGRTRAAPSEA